MNLLWIHPYKQSLAGFTAKAILCFRNALPACILFHEAHPSTQRCGSTSYNRYPSPSRWPVQNYLAGPSCVLEPESSLMRSDPFAAGSVPAAAKSLLSGTLRFGKLAAPENAQSIGRTGLLSANVGRNASIDIEYQCGTRPFSDQGNSPTTIRGKSKCNSSFQPCSLRRSWCCQHVAKALILSALLWAPVQAASRLTSSTRVNVWSVRRSVAPQAHFRTISTASKAGARISRKIVKFGAGLRCCRSASFVSAGA